MNALSSEFHFHFLFLLYPVQSINISTCYVSMFFLNIFVLSSFCILTYLIDYFLGGMFSAHFSCGDGGVDEVVADR
jgi:hypothetical protein